MTPLSLVQEPRGSAARVPLVRDRVFGTNRERYSFQSLSFVTRNKSGRTRFDCHLSLVSIRQVIPDVLESFLPLFFVSLAVVIVNPLADSRRQGC